MSNTRPTKRAIDKPTSTLLNEEGEIKPAQLWAFLKDNDDIQLVGKVCVALGGHNVELNAAERACLNLIIRDSVWRKRNVELKKLRNAEYYEKMKWLKKIQSDSETENGLKKIQSDSAPIHPSVPPSSQEELDADAVARTRARGKAPTIEEILRFAADNTHHPDGKAYPDEWARGWYVYMEQSDPPWTKNGSPIGSWRQKMITDWAIHQKEVRNESGKSNRRSGEADRSTHYEEGLGAELGRKYGI